MNTIKILHPTYKIITRWIIDLSEQRKGLRVVDYGCGNGYLLDLLPKKAITNYTGFEVNSDSVSVAQKKYKQGKIKFIDFIPGKVPELGPVNSADVLVLIGVLQYMSDKEIAELVSKSKKVLKKNGVFLSSCIVDHWLYKVMDIYKFFLPQRYLNRNKLIKLLDNNGFDIEYQKEKGIFLAPLFSHCLVVFFDALDKLIFRQKGKLGKFGTWFRSFYTPILNLEYKLPIDYGYTLYLRAVNK